MPPAFDEMPTDKGNPETWADLNGEETRCLLGLQSYYTRIEDKAAQEALELAWVDLKREFQRLQPFPWYK